ncbi:unnamed protein product [Acanthoscelides obtectus]|uniref:Large ribosomal subunit protein bL34m n=1 Tax=Acanthoscelides obtectus TaxID=200917 RepID=A0A9P0PRQ4_ACAOB|nr:unnamed protein product [Acanthoscelides obtectus]CAK1662712.1 39S ribosomal protein L34, mitochondrial [Acanthoscelides obtectus]
MSLLSRVFANVCSTINRYATVAVQQTTNFHSLTSSPVSQASPGGLFNIAVRTNIRVHFPRPSERRRIKRHGYWQRMKTREGRRVLMNRILKGRWVYSH